jgi:hypothetical protein
VRRAGPLTARLRAADAVWTLLAPDLVTGLLDGCGWPEDEVERWLTEQLGTALLGPGVAPAHPG